MNTMYKLSSLALALSLALAGNIAHAELLTQDFTVRDGKGNLIAAHATGLDWNQLGSGVAVGVGPYSTLLQVGAEYDFLYQANLVNISGAVGPGDQGATYNRLDASPNGAPNLNKSFEFTLVSRQREVVLQSLGVGASSYAMSGLVDGPGNKVAIFYDEAMNADTTKGTGFDDGIMIALLSIVSDGTGSDFSGKTASAGQGSARIHARIVAGAGDFIDPAYLIGMDDLMLGLSFEGNLAYPAGAASALAFHASGTDPRFPTYHVTDNDIVVKVDGNNDFTRVPEPGSMLLMTIGMLGMAGVARRRKQTKA